MSPKEKDFVIMKKPLGPTEIVTPIDPWISRYPLPMSARRAKFERKRAQAIGVRLPRGHPYRILPSWVPYFIARLFAGAK